MTAEIIYGTDFQRTIPKPNPDIACQLSAVYSAQQEQPPRLMSQMIGVPSFTFDGFDPRDPDPA